MKTKPVAMFPSPDQWRSMWYRFCQHVVVDDETGCWVWTGGRTKDGYGALWLRYDVLAATGELTVKRRMLRAHRLAWMRFARLPLVDGWELHHTCENKLCVNPDHLRQVSARDNLMETPTMQTAMNAAKTHCPQGHPYSGSNLYTYEHRQPDGRVYRYRMCKACARERQRGNRTATQAPAIAAS